MDIILKKLALSTCLAIFILCFSGTANAEKITDYGYIMQMEYTRFQGMTTYISTTDDYIIASGFKIHLIEVVHDTGTYTTSFYDTRGNPIDRETLKIGDWISVWGGVRRGNSIAAKDIFTIPRNLSNSDLNGLLLE